MTEQLKNIRTWGGLLLAVFVLAISSAFLLYNLGTEPLQDYDEATYAEVVHEAFINHDYLSYTEEGVSYFKKPPLMFWAMAVSESVLGETPFAMRIPFALTGVLLIAVVMLLVFEVTTNWWVAALGGAVLATAAPFMETARQVRLDVPVTFFIVLATYFFLRGFKNSRWFVPFGIAVGLAVLVKSVIAVFAIVAALFVLVLYKRFDVFSDRFLHWGIVAGALVVLPWHMYEWTLFGNAFWAQYIGVEVLARTQENLFWTVTITNADYARYLAQFTQPWLGVFFVALMAVLVGWKRVAKEPRNLAAAFALTILAMAAVFFTAKTKAPTYFTPVYPFAAMTIALVLHMLRPRSAQVAAGVLLALLLVIAAQLTFYNAYHYNPYYSVVLAMAKDEEKIGTLLLTVPQTTDVYAYQNQNLGSIIFYSQHQHVLPLTATTTPKSGSYVTVATNALPLISQNFPELATLLLYQGPQVSLLQIIN